MKTIAILRISILACTALSLVAHGGNERICAWNDSNSEEFDVVGQCGEAGTIVLSEPGGTCDLTLRGDDVGLPREGKSDRGGNLEGEVGWTDEELSCSISTHGRDSERREVRCYGEEGQVCRSYFIPVVEECDVVSCEIPTCQEGETLDLEDDECCPTCVPCPSCVPSTPEPSCDPSACEPLDCEEHFEISEGSCCARCVPSVVESLCEEGREAHRLDWEETKDEWLSCSSDEDCNLIDTGTQCGRQCGFLFSGSALGDSYIEVMSLSNERCQHCPPVTDACPDLIGEPRCVEGMCVVE